MYGICIREEGCDKTAAVGPDRDRVGTTRGHERPGRDGYTTPSFGVSAGILVQTSWPWLVAGQITVVFSHACNR